MNVKTYNRHQDDGHDHEGCQELAGLIENMLRPIDQLTLSENFNLHVVPTKYLGPEAILFHNTYRLAHFDIKADTLEMRVSYISKSKMGRLHTNFVYVPLAVPGTVERIQDMVRKALQIYARWLTKPKIKPASEKPKNKKSRIAYRRR
jgi:hypothetical protein